MGSEQVSTLCAPGAWLARGSPSRRPRLAGWAVARTCGQVPAASGRGRRGPDGVSLPRHGGQALIAFFRGLCAACSFIVAPTQCRGELRSHFHPSALDFLSFVGRRTDYATRLPVISAPGLLLPGADLPREPGTGSLEGTTKTCPWAPSRAGPGPGCRRR